MPPRPDTPGAAEQAGLDEAGYERLALLRTGIRRYLAFAEGCAREHGMSMGQVQLALAVRSHDDPAGPTLTELADALLLRHHSVVGLVDRGERAGLVARVRSPARQTCVHVRLTASGAERLDAVGARHLDWLDRHGSELAAACATFAAP